MKKVLAIITLLLALGIPALAQTVVPGIRVGDAGGAPSCTPGKLCRARGFNFLLGYPSGFGWANGATVSVFSIMPDGSQIPSPRAIPNIDRVDFYPAIGTEGAVAFRFVSRFYDVQSAPLQTPIPTFAPILHARGSFCYSRPAPGACAAFDGVVEFPRHVGLLSITFDAAGIGAFSTDWTLVIENGSTSEASTFGVEVPATGYPASSATYVDTINATVGFVNPGFYFVSIYKFVPGGTIVRSPRVGLTIQ